MRSVLGASTVWCVLVLALAVPSGAEIVVRITSPAPGLPIFDRVEIAATVASSEEIERVELWLDGELVGTITEPPNRWWVDVGSENREHRIKVVAHGRSGATGRAELLTPEITVHDQLDVDLQQLYVTVTGRGGQRVLDLEADDFRVFDEQLPQQIVTFARGDIPFTAAILVDGSDSMRGRRLRASLAGAQQFVAGMRQLDEARLMVFADRLLRMTPWSSSSRPLEEALQGVEAEGGTAIYDHLYLALTQLESRQGRRVVILLTDGWDAQSVLGAEQLRRVARRGQALIYWVRLTGDEPGPGRVLGRGSRGGLEPVRLLPTNAWYDESAGRKSYALLEKIVRETGGRVVSVGHVSEIESTFADLLAELREQYAIGYEPDPRRNDGSWREVSVELARKGLKVRVREGYVDR